MHAASPALEAFINNQSINDCIQIDLYTFVLSSGEVLKYSGGNVAIPLSESAFPATSYNAFTPTSNFILGPRFGRSKVNTKVGIEPSELGVEVFAGAADLIGTFSFANAARMGLFDGADVELDRLFIPMSFDGTDLDLSLGCLIWFMGKVAEVDIGRSKITFKVKSYMNLLAVQQMPRRIFSSACSHVFGDAMCGYDRVNGLNALGESTGVGQFEWTASSTTQSQVTMTLSVPSYYIEGSIIGVTGQNAGFTRTIANVIGTTVYLFKPWLYPVASGDIFQTLPGCDHTTTYCNGTLMNIGRFGGFPYIPPPEYAV